MAFKMKNKAVMKMAKMAGDNRTAMKLKAEDAAMKMKKQSAMKMKKDSPMKIDFSKIKKSASDKIKGLKAGFKDYFADLTGGQTSREKSKIAERERELREMKKKNPKQFEKSMKNFPDAVYDPDKKSKIRS